MARIGELMERGRYVDAVSLAEELVANQIEDFGPQDREVGYCLNVLGFAVRQSGRPADAIAHHEEALRIFRATLGPKSPDVARTLSLLGGAHLSAGHLDIAEPKLVLALELSLEAFGEVHEATAGAYNDLGYLRSVQGHKEEAKRLLKKSLVLFAATLGPAHVRLTYPRSNLAELLEGEGRWADALSEYIQILEIQIRTLGEEHPETARTHGNIARNAKLLADYQMARQHYEMALAIMEGSGHPDRARYRAGMGSVLSAEGKYEEAFSSFQNAYEIYVESYGSDHPDTMTSLNNVASVLQDLGRLVEAEANYEAYLKSVRVRFGSHSEDVALAQSNLATVKIDLGAFSEAQVLLEQALGIRETQLGDHPQTAVTLTNLGHVLKARGDLVTAERHYRRVLEIRQSFLGPEHPKTLSSLNNLAAVLEARGDTVGALKLYETVLELRRKTLPSDHPQVAISLNNLGLLFASEYRVREAEALFREALEVWTQAFGGEHPLVATCLQNLAQTMGQRGNPEAEIDLIRKSLRIRQHGLGEKHPDTALSYHNLGYSLLETRRFGEAERHLERAVEIREEIFGLSHPGVAASLLGLAIVREAQGDLASSIELTERALEIQGQWLGPVLEMGDDHAKRGLLSSFRGSMERAVSLHLRSARDDPRVAEMAMTSVLRYKGRALDVGIVQRRLGRRSSDPKVKNLLADLRARRESEVRLVLHPPGQMVPGDVAARLKEVGAQVRELETALTDASPLSPMFSRRIDVDVVRESISAGTALIEFVAYRPFNVSAEPEPWGPTRFAAYLLTSSKAPRAVDLGPVSTIDAEVEAFRLAVEGSDPKMTEHGRRLHQLLLGPLQAALQGVDTLRIAPDGALFMVPFAALVGPDGRYLVEAKTVSHLSSGRALLDIGTAPVALESPLVIGGPAFDALPAREGRPSTAGNPDTDLLPNSFSPLAGALVEAETVGHLLGLAPDRVLTRRAATETAVKSVRGPKLLHLATHGFYLTDPAPSQLGLWDERSLFRLPEVVSWSDIRSAIALSGYNHRDRGDSVDDGVLTAREVRDLDLGGTEIVVLSACSSGVGNIRQGQGIFGLRRALAMAGARSQLTTLWRVSDGATQQFMEAWYTGLQRGMDRAEALRHVQLMFLRGEKELLPGEVSSAEEEEARGTRPMAEHPIVGLAHPRYWASFVLSGDVGPVALGTPVTSGSAMSPSTISEEEFDQ